MEVMKRDSDYCLVPMVHLKELTSSIEAMGEQLQKQSEQIDSLVDKEANVSYTRQETADFLNISLPTLDKRLQLGEIESFKVGRAVRIPKKAVQEYMSSDQSK